MKKIITLLTILLLSKFSFAATHPVADTLSINPTYPNCNNGAIFVSNIHNQEGLFLGSFNVFLSKWNGSGYVDAYYNFDVGTATFFLNLSAGDYRIRVNFTAAADPNLLLLNYNEGLLPIIEKISSRMAITFTADELAKMKERLLFQGKQPQLYFSPEPEIESIADKFSGVFELYDRLEEIRGKMLREETV